MLLSDFLLLDIWEDGERANTGYYLVISLLLFRPIMVTLFTAQFVAFFLIFSSLAIYLWKKEKWLLGGLIISLFNFKPSYGAFILVLVGIWLLIEKQKKAILGIVIGNLALVLLTFCRIRTGFNCFGKQGNGNLDKRLDLIQPFGAPSTFCAKRMVSVSRLRAERLLWFY